uniref:DUF4159 domain-containing protein n=1 Tax=Stappia sp. TaxID=1870903 RepID=UPI003BAC0FB6
MSSLLPLGFAAPLALVGLLLLPVIWWLLRLLPPSPRRIAFPPARLLEGIEKRDETPDTSPLWLTILRLLLAAALILALAGPQWRPGTDTPAGDGPLWIVLDNGWAASADWETRRGAAERLVASAAEEGRPVLLAATAEGPDQPLVTQDARSVLERLRAMEPRPWPTTRGELTIALRKAATTRAPGAIVWYSDGVARATSARFVEDLRAIAGTADLTVYTGLDHPPVLAGARNDPEALTASIIPAPGTPGDAALPSVRAYDEKGLVLGETQATAGEREGLLDMQLELPVELRNDVARLEIDGARSAAAVQLLDDRWQRRTVGLVSGASADQAQPLLSPLYYLERALSPFAELRHAREADVADAATALIAQGVSVLVMADVGRLSEPAEAALRRWIEQGGVLVRFAGPRLAGGSDDLVPTRLRSGDRALGGALSWEEPQPLASFAEGSPFATLPVPSDVTVSRQVLAEPGPDLTDRSWALLADGTPLVTASTLGRGTLILFHVTADAGWSNLPLSGTFVEMLRRITALSATVAPDAGASGRDAAGTTAVAGANEAAVQLPPVRVLDGSGRLGPPPASAVPLPASGDIAASRRNPPGLYGASDAFRALNLFPQATTIEALDLSPLEGARIADYPRETSVDLRPPLFVLALLLLFADAVAMLVMRGERRGLRPGRGMPGFGAVVMAIALALTLSAPREANAQESSADITALEATLDTRLAYVLTGDQALDETSRMGLFGLSRYLASRTALEPEAPMGVDPARDELAFYPLLYWPVRAETPIPGPEALSAIDTYMRNGGTILFDTGDQLATGLTGLGTSPAVLRLRRILETLDIPPLEPVPVDHVLTKAFYILDSFPGRYAGGPLWVEASEPGTQDDPVRRPVRGGDGISPILITGNDLAGAWAVDDAGGYAFQTVPADPLQREYAFRSGVNIVMYVLTGNYKADQVHIPALLERLGQ